MKEQIQGGGTRAYPIAEALSRLGIGSTKGYELIKSGELETYTIGRHRYATETALQKFVRKRMREAAKETAVQRSSRVAKAVAERGRRREPVAS